MKINITQGREIEKIRSEYSPGDKEIIYDNVTKYVESHPENPVEKLVIDKFKNSSEWPVVSYLLESDSDFKLMLDDCFYKIMDGIESASYALEVSNNKHEPWGIE